MQTGQKENQDQTVIDKPHLLDATLLFTDIEGSTRLWERFPDLMRTALARHDEIIREMVEQNSGFVFKPLGDAFCTIFTNAEDAVRAALKVQCTLSRESWEEMGSLKVRIAVVSGTVEKRERDYFGPALNRASRLLQAGHGGQILLSATAADLVKEKLPEKASLRDLGAHRLRDLPEPERFFQVIHPDLAFDFPPLRSLEAFSHNLPLQLTTFVGRENEMAEVRRLLSETRLLTFMGSGGCGKTRLALQVAHSLVESYPDGVWIAQFALITNPEFVPQMVAAALGVREEPGRPLSLSLADHLRRRKLLLILDNCEHLIEACADLAQTLLQSCPDLRILATSREILGIAGEVIFKIPSLSDSEAMQLFAQRAKMALPSMQFSEENMQLAARICSRLDGIPLAIELAAGKVKVFSIEEIASRLDDAFRLLTGGSRTALPRHRTLRAAIDWGYNLLSEEEKILFSRLSIFVGGFTIQAMEAVCSGAGIESHDLVELLSRLVDKSLVVVGEGADETARYRLLETIREYALEKLEEEGELEYLGRLHRDYYVSLALEAEPKLTGAKQAECLKALEAEHSNIRAALKFCMDWDDAQSGLTIAGALWRFWWARGHLKEGMEYLTAFVALPQKEKALSAKALRGIGGIAFEQGDYELARTSLEEALDIFMEMQDNQAIADCLNCLGLVFLQEGNHTGARQHFEKSLAASRRTGDKEGIGKAICNLGNVAWYEGDYNQAITHFEEFLSLSKELGDLHRAASALANLGNVRARQGLHVEALACLEEGLEISLKLKDGLLVPFLLESLAIVICAHGDAGKAACLMGAASSVRNKTAAPLPTADKADYEQLEKKTRELLSEDNFSEAFEKGRAMSAEEAVLFALNKII